VESPDLRAPLPVGFLGESADMDETVQRLDRAVRGLSVRARLADARGRLKLRLIERLRPLPSAHLRSLDQVDRVDLDTLVAKRPGMLCHVARNGSSADLTFPGNRLTGPAGIESALRFFAGSDDAFRVRAVPDTLSDDSKVVLVKRAIREGLLEIR
jgi:lysine-specific demethylase/histidyl-hydroxylase NO66